MQNISIDQKHTPANTQTTRPLLLEGSPSRSPARGEFLAPALNVSLAVESKDACILGEERKYHLIETALRMQSTLFKTKEYISIY